MRYLKTIFKANQAVIISLSIFCLLIIATLKYTSYKKGLWEKDVRSDLLEILVGEKSKLEKALFSRIYYTKGVAAYVSFHPDITDHEFQMLANELIKTDTVISSMALSKDCIIGSVFPYEGHEAALGLNLLDHPERKEIVEKTIETHKTFVAGPVELVEGGIAIISYTPIFDKSNNDSNKFWGVTDIVIYRDKLFNEAGLLKSDNNFEYALKGYNGTGNKGDVFWGDENIFKKNPVAITIDLPDGAWILGAVPINGWSKYLDQDDALTLVLILSSIIISILTWLFSRALIRIKNNEKELVAIFNSMDNLIVELDREGRYIKIAPTNEQLLYLPAKELLGKTVHQVFDKEIAELFHKSIVKCLDTKKIVIIEYSLNIKNTEQWFSARVSYKSENSVIFNCYDITEKKKIEENIRKSEQQLKELNDMKDKFFSILAHDLRNPIGNFQNMTEIMIEDFDILQEEDRKRFLKGMYNASIGINTLLENILEWSNSQQGKLSINLGNHRIKNVCDRVIKSQLAGSQLKSITISNEVQSGVLAYFDQNMTETILRNLISNAIKFSRDTEKIKIYSEKAERDGNQYQVIHVSDTGVGISKENIKKLFKIDVSTTTTGTKDEKGSGLGLLLCKEFVEKQGGTIWVESEEGKGSIFSFSLPAKKG